MVPLLFEGMAVMGRGVRVLHLHLHGLFRSRDLELGRDADTGGQTLYVLDLAVSYTHLTLPTKRIV